MNQWFSVVGASQEIRPNRDGFRVPHVRIIHHWAWAKNEAMARADFFLRVLKEYPSEDFSGIQAFQMPNKPPEGEAS